MRKKESERGREREKDEKRKEVCVREREKKKREKKESMCVGVCEREIERLSEILKVAASRSKCDFEYLRSRLSAHSLVSTEDNVYVCRCCVSTVKV
jgi:hypothetical protein